MHIAEYAAYRGAQKHETTDYRENDEKEYQCILHQILTSLAEVLARPRRHTVVLLRLAVCQPRIAQRATWLMRAFGGWPFVAHINECAWSYTHGSILVQRDSRVDGIADDAGLSQCVHIAPVTLHRAPAWDHCSPAWPSV